MRLASVFSADSIGLSLVCFFVAIWSLLLAQLKMRCFASTSSVRVRGNYLLDRDVAGTAWRQCLDDRAQRVSEGAAQRIGDRGDGRHQLGRVVLFGHFLTLRCKLTSVRFG